MVGIVELIAGVSILVLINRIFKIVSLKKENSVLSTNALVLQDEVSRKEKLIKELKSELKNVYSQIELFKTESCDKVCECEPDVEVEVKQKAKTKKK